MWQELKRERESWTLEASDKSDKTWSDGGGGVTDATIGCQQREAETDERNDTETHVEVEGVTSNEWGL